MISYGELHHFILQYIIDNGHAPDVNKISQSLNITTDEVLSSLNDLQSNHGVVLHPNQPKVWIIHPFSLAPTNFLVKTEDGVWYGNCAWCSLGCAALLKKDCTITTSFGAYGERVDIHIINGEISEKDLVVHFPIPMVNAWDNVVYTCSNMLLFKQAIDVEKWCKRHDMPVGDIQPLSKLWNFSQEWYGNHLDKNWIKCSATKAQEIFIKHDLTHPVWDLKLNDSTKETRF